MPEHETPAPVVGKEEARQGRPQGFVRTIMYISIALALIGMFIAYLVIKP
jgi:Sec-independent protein secretion pathway component TatC